ncbi:MAG: radical SAM protein [Ruminococcaceae bacterium]|nr:radical SAM protein [Oscillospiraceae bacterium]
MKVINYHICGTCNYQCKYCFANFGERDPSKEVAMNIIKEIHNFFMRSGVSDGRVNIAGGEPLLYPYLTDVIECISGLGMKASVITNGSLLSEKLLSKWSQKVEMIGISIDAVSEQGNVRIGRNQQGSILTTEQLIRKAHLIRKYGIQLKVNTVVSKLNLEEDMLSIYRRMNPDKLKFLCVHVLENVNAEAERLQPTQEEFDAFVAKNRYNESCKVVVEPKGAMQNSYLMISPQGTVFLNEGGREKKYGNCLNNELYEICEQLPFDSNKYNLRY